jgi:mannose-6-phosphate isomerase-like protein (cupin superfamily)
MKAMEALKKYVSRFNKETAPSGHAGTILAGDVLPPGLKAPFGAAWGYLEGKSVMEEHSHPTEEIYLVFDGKGFCHINGERFPVAPGDVIQIPPDAMHTVECEENEKILWAAFWWQPC